MSTNPRATADRLVSNLRIRDRLLFLLTVSSGAVDAVTFLALGKVFTAFMTGNIVFLGLGIAGNAEAPSVVAILASLAGFGAGIYLATKIVTCFKREQQPAGVWPLGTTWALGISLLAHFCFVLIWFATAGRPNGVVTLLLVGAWSLAMGVQSAAVRWLDISGVFTTAATATFLFLVGDFSKQTLTNKERRRLLGVLASLCIGAASGGFLLLHAPIYAPVLSFVITLGVVATAVMAFGNRHRVLSEAEG